MSLQLSRPTEKPLGCLGRATDKQALAMQHELDTRHYNPGHGTIKSSCALLRTFECIEQANGITHTPTLGLNLISLA